MKSAALSAVAVLVVMCLPFSFERLCNIPTNAISNIADIFANAIREYSDIPARSHRVSLHVLLHVIAYIYIFYFVFFDIYQVYHPSWANLDEQEGQTRSQCPKLGIAIHNFSWITKRCIGNERDEP